MKNTFRPAAALLARAWPLVFVAGCATFSSDGGFDAVDSAVHERTGARPRWVRSDRDRADLAASVERLLAQPLDADVAMQIALVNNPALQATYAELGLSEADLVQAGRLPNPVFAFERLARGGELEITRTFVADVLALLTMPARTRVERQRFAATKLRVAAEATRIAADTRRAYYAAVAARESAKYMAQVNDAAEASAELAQRMAKAGNLSRLDEAREQVFHAEAVAQLARVRQAATAQRERLTRLLGLSRADAYTLPERLPDLPQAPRDDRALETTALERRLDVQAAMKEAEAVAASFGLARATGMVNVLDVGYQHNSESGKPPQRGWDVDLTLPVFDWGDARAARARASYMQAVNRAGELAIRARSEVREAADAYRAAHDVARRYRDDVVPLTRRIAEENVLRYNGMLVSVFELLADARRQVASVNAYIEALRDFWIADATLQAALTGSGGSATAPGLSMVGRANTAGGH